MQLTGTLSFPTTVPFAPLSTNLGQRHHGVSSDRHARRRSKDSCPGLAEGGGVEQPHNPTGPSSSVVGKPRVRSVRSGVRVRTFKKRRRANRGLVENFAPSLSFTITACTDDRSLSIPTASTPSSRAVSPSHRRLCDAVWCCVCSASQTVSTRSTTHSTSKGHCRNGNSPREKHDVYEPRRLPPPRPLVPKRSNAATLPRQPCDCPAKAPAVAAPPTQRGEALSWAQSSGEEGRRLR
ncbi:hypothetical protein IWX90DRAFT_274280 [Phyllosticta citrichinensis]|uniref:Uncharacterized protein n=1 Tax=Phyllosticta citrichinensis TaxID=1130410 RepID=A0ABR1XMY6_9PEZI